MTDWWADSAAWASAVGTISATVTALYIASRSWREAAVEREDRDAIQARRIVVDDNEKGSFKIVNLSDAPILDVGALSAIRHRLYDINPPEVLDTRLREDSSGMRTVLRPNETLTVDVLTENYSNIRLTIRFTDANGLAWKRTRNNPPRRLFERKQKGRRGILSLIRQKRFERRYVECGLNRARSRSEISQPLLQSGFEGGAHGRAYVPIDAVHAWHLVAHPFGLQDLRNAVFVHPCLKAVPQAMRRHASLDRQPRRHGYVLSGRLPGTFTAALLPSRVCDQHSIHTPRPCPAANRATTGLLVIHQPGQPAPCRRHKPLPRCSGWPRRHWPTRERIASRYENGNGWPGFPVPGQVPAISSGPEEPLAVVGPAEMPPAGAEKDIFDTRAPRLLGVVAGAFSRPFQDRLRVGSRCVAWCCDVIMSGVPGGPTCDTLGAPRGRIGR